MNEKSKGAAFMLPRYMVGNKASGTARLVSRVCRTKHGTARLVFRVYPRCQLDLAVKNVSGLACSLACPTSTGDAKIKISSTEMSCCVSTINGVNFLVLDVRVNVFGV